MNQERHLLSDLCMAHLSTRYSKFRRRALFETETLFVVVADECHWGITLNGASCDLGISPSPTVRSAL